MFSIIIVVGWLVCWSVGWLVGWLVVTIHGLNLLTMMNYQVMVWTSQRQTVRLSLSEREGKHTLYIVYTIYVRTFHEV